MKRELERLLALIYSGTWFSASQREEAGHIVRELIAAQPDKEKE